MTDDRAPRPDADHRPERREDPGNRTLQVPLWDWPAEAEHEQTAAPVAPQPSPVAVEVREVEPAVDEALTVIAGSLAEMAATETRPLLDPPERRPRLRRIGDTDLAVFPVVLGGSTFGWTASADATAGILDAYVDAGGNAIDTADSYSAGRSETLVGAWLRSRRNRDRIVLSTKISGSAENPGLSAQSIVRSAEASLTRLGVDSVDLLVFAADDPSVPLEESLTAADSLLRSGKVRHLAASAFSPERLMEARITSGQLILPRFAGIQAHYNLLHREEFEHRLFPVAKAQGLAVLPYVALANGFLSGKYRSRSGRGADAHSRSALIEQHLTKRGFRVLSALDEVAQQQGVAPATVALAWLLTKPLVTAPVASASRPEQVADLVAAAEVHLTRSQVAALDRASEH
ncbi:aldo/keto reductase [Naasia sp. SYSU D00057]|uniref:aldo/keto reductase n=1 Tax=Naasia sp. SYSU D00057 TaxID=2817380 RepID=UPI0027DCB6A0|nr:aldo/keto reductase [Naasia sp. SYSU D00057]